MKDDRILLAVTSVVTELGNLTDTLKITTEGPPVALVVSLAVMQASV